jgi:hypothetical protein
MSEVWARGKASSRRSAFVPCSCPSFGSTSTTRNHYGPSKRLGTPIESTRVSMLTGRPIHQQSTRLRAYIPNDIQSLSVVTVESNYFRMTDQPDGTEGKRCAVNVRGCARSQQYLSIGMMPRFGAASPCMTPLFDANDHGIRPNQPFHPRLPEAGLLHPLAAIRARIVEAVLRFD